MKITDYDRGKIKMQKTNKQTKITRDYLEKRCFTGHATGAVRKHSINKTYSSYFAGFKNYWTSVKIQTNQKIESKEFLLRIQTVVHSRLATAARNIELVASDEFLDLFASTQRASFYMNNNIKNNKINDKTEQ